ncbi:hypothetical protein M3223_01735 [Paenibacillus pasadenensis]|uniref:hypothetical protein n=1 Tax=Paenibacillus pasadenensis TaxID=217090 RepID=UPI002041FD0A|nr:hypothetical protein [Paenibacillus pasadenensis]MCM3746069.1 hypothetical protein [Paenibacillus pasadenensis]
MYRSRKSATEIMFKIGLLFFILFGSFCFAALGRSSAAVASQAAFELFNGGGMEISHAADITSTEMSAALQDEQPPSSLHDHISSLPGSASSGIWKTVQDVISVVGLTGIVIASAIVMFRIRFWREPLQMPLMMACMGVAMAAGLSGGAILSILLKSFTLPAIACAAAAAAAGYYAGNRHGAVPAMEGFFAGLMGGLMGPMLGIMAISDFPAAVVVFSLVLFVVYLGLAKRLLHEDGFREEAVETEEPQPAS